jgi:hypothetical protein
MNYSPWRELAMTDLSLVWRRLEGLDSYFDPHLREVGMDPRLNQSERRCALTHELIHAERADSAIADPVLAAKQERAVDCEAARRLISLDALTDALMWTAHRRELADTLGVDVPTAYCRLSHLTELELNYIRGRWAAREASA